MNSKTEKFIFSFLSCEERAAVTCVCRRWKKKTKRVIYLKIDFFLQRLELLQWAENNLRYKITYKTIRPAVSQKPINYDVIEYLCSKRLTFSITSMNLVCKNGDVQILKLLLGKGYKFHRRTASFMALEGNNSDVLLYLHKEHNCYWGPDLCFSAVMKQKLAMLKLLLNSGCRANAEITSIACFAGDLEILKYLVEECQYPIDYRAYGQCKNMQVFNYLQTIIPKPKSTLSPDERSHKSLW